MAEFEPQDVAEMAKALDEDFAAWRKSLRASEIAELRSYQGIGYWRINSVLRDVNDAASFDSDALRRVDIAIEALDNVISRGHLARPVWAYRGFGNAHIVLGVGDLRDLLGKPIGDYGYVSTSIDPDVALRIAMPSADPMIVEMKLQPK